MTSVFLAGLGWVTPLGSDLNGVWEALREGREGEITFLSSPVSDRRYPVMAVPAEATASLPRHPRLRRASAISRFAAAAGLAALRDAGLELNETTAQRTALVFAISNGGVIYTERFFHEIVQSGPQAASPLLFPETVFNAPASHLAAILGLSGATYTLVGDGAVGLLALRMAHDLMANEDIDHCLVVAAEEADWLLCDAYRRWRLLRTVPPPSLYDAKARGMIPSEGAGALLLARSGKIELRTTSAGTNYARRSECAEAAARVLGELGRPDLLVTSANGTFIDEAERKALGMLPSGALVYPPKGALGEGVGASGLWQTIVAARALATGQLPAALHAEPGPVGVNRAPLAGASFREAAILSCGLNQQVAGALLSLG